MWIRNIYSNGDKVIASVLTNAKDHFPARELDGMIQNTKADNNVAQMEAYEIKNLLKGSGILGIVRSKKRLIHRM